MHILIDCGYPLPQQHLEAARQVAAVLSGQPGLILSVRADPRSSSESAPALWSLSQVSHPGTADIRLVFGRPSDNDQANRSRLTLVFAEPLTDPAQAELVARPTLMAWSAQPGLAWWVLSERARARLVRGGADPAKVVLMSPDVDVAMGPPVEAANQSTNPTCPAQVTERWGHWLAKPLLQLLSDPEQPCWQAFPHASQAPDSMADAYALALKAYGKGQTAVAAQRCADILKQQPGHADAVFLLGAIEFDTGRPELALQHFELAVSRRPGDAGFHNAQAEAWRALGKLTEAVNSFEAALLLNPTFAAAHLGLGLARLDLGHTAEAIDSFRRAVTLRPGHAQTFLNLGRALQITGDLQGAAQGYSRAIQIKPDYPIALNNLGAVLFEQKRAADALPHLRRALELKKDYPEAHYNLGNVWLSLEDPAQALRCYDEALRLRPGYSNALLQRGIALETLGEHVQALQTFEQFVALRPAQPQGWQRLASLLMLKRDWKLALHALNKAAEVLADPGEVLANQIYVRKMMCDWRGLAQDEALLWDRAQQRIKAGQPSGVPPFFSIVFGWPAERQRVIARAEAGKFSDLPLVASGPARNTGARRLRVGYLSGDLHDHAVSHLTQGMFSLHDRTRFEIHAYSFGPDDTSSYRQRIVQGCEHFVDVRRLSDAALARRIADDGIDILVDMMGYSGFTRLGAMAQRPAPVQASWLSYPGTTGTDFIDYVIADRMVAPAVNAAHFSEKLIRLPHCYIVTDDTTPIDNEPAQRREHGLPETGVVFCSWNNSYKIEPDIFACWMQILQQTPGSVLWLYTAGDDMEANLRMQAQARNVDPARLVFGRNLSPKSAHLARLRLADLFLDTLHYNAHTTACDALWAGVPLITCPGQTMASRAAASMLSACGLPELVTPDLASYEQLAVRLAHNQPERQALRERLAQQRTRAPLFDTGLFVGHLERAFTAMWELHQSGLPAQDITL